MAAAIKPGWSKPSTILFACEIPANERAFAFALAQAVEFGARLILFHAGATREASGPEPSGLLHDESAGADPAEFEPSEPLNALARRVWEAGVECEIVVRPGLPASRILAFLRERESVREIDRIVMGAHSPGPIGKLLIGSVAEALLRTVPLPVCVIGPEVVNGRYRNFATRTILCGVSLHRSSSMVVGFAAELAAEQNARLILLHVIPPHQRPEVLDGRSIGQLEAEMVALVPAELQGGIKAQPMVVPGDPTEELLYQGRAEQAGLIVLGARGASAFAAITRHGVVYKLLAHAHCPVMTLSPVVLAACGVNREPAHQGEMFLAGVF